MKFSLPGIAAWLAGFGGLAAIAASVLLPWFSIPWLSPENQVTNQTSLASAIFRVICAFTLFLALGSRLAFPAWRRQCGLLFVALLVVLLFFPYCVTVWSPTISGEASWIQNQHESLTTSTGDIYTSQEEKDAFLRQRTYLVNRPIDSEIFYLPDWGPQNFAWGRLIEVMEWFGISTWFAAFVRKGWVLAVSGAGLVVVALCRQCGERIEIYTTWLARRALAIFVLVLAFALLPTFIAGAKLTRAKRAAQRGDHAVSLQALQAASCWMPAMRECEDYVMQQGLLEDALHRDTPEASFYRTRRLEELGFDFEARSRYLEALARGDWSPVLRRECVKALIAQAANAINSGELNPAVFLLQRVLAEDPCNLKANYALQLASLRSGDVETVLRLRERMGDVYRYYGMPTKQAVLALADENVAYGENSRGNYHGAIAAWRAAKRR